MGFRTARGSQVPTEAAGKYGYEARRPSVHVHSVGPGDSPSLPH